MNDDQLLRYSRQILLPGIEVDGQLKFASAHVVIVGAGGLGNPVGLYLAAAGVGRITVVDDDAIELSNIARQIAFTDDDIGASKAAILGREMRRRNPDIEVFEEPVRLTADNASALLLGADVVVDCSDNFAARFAINDACLALSIPVVFAAATAWHGQLFVMHPSVDNYPCYECFNPSREELDNSCARNGVLGPLVGVIASQQAIETLRILLGMPSQPVLQVYDARHSEWLRINMAKRDGCHCQSK